MSALTDEQYKQITESAGLNWDYMSYRERDMMRSVAEAAVQAARDGQEPVGEVVQAFADLVCVNIPVMPPVGTKLYTTPPAAPVPEDVAKDAERYRWLRAHWTTMRSTATDTTLKLTTGEEPWADFGPEVIDAAIDSAMLIALEAE